MTAYEAAILDVDGTIVRGERLLPGAAAGLRALDDAGVPRLLFSNNPTRSADHYRDRVAAHGVAVGEGLALTSATVTADYLSRSHGSASIYLVGEARLARILERAGLEVTGEPADADVVLGSIDREFDYDALAAAMRALERDVPFYGTDPDVTIPAGEGTVPGSGAMLAAMTAVAGREPDAILGKPSEIAAEAALSRLGADPSRTLVVGDRLDTDVALGDRMGATTALVLSGITDREDLDGADVRPDHVLEDLGDVGRLLD